MSGAKRLTADAADRYAVVDWIDPMQTAQRLATMSGVDGLRAVANGALPPPPIAQLLGMEIVEVDVGRVVFGLDPSEQHYNPIGSVHGGIAATLIDSATGCAVHSLLPAGRGYATVDLTVNYDRPITVGTGRISCEAKIINRGSRIVTAEGRVTAEATGKLLAHGQTTCMLLGG